MSPEEIATRFVNEAKKEDFIKSVYNFYTDYDKIVVKVTKEADGYWYPTPFCICTCQLHDGSYIQEKIGAYTTLALAAHILYLQIDVGAVISPDNHDEIVLNRDDSWQTLALQGENLYEGILSAIHEYVK